MHSITKACHGLLSLWAVAMRGGGDAINGRCGHGCHLFHQTLTQAVSRQCFLFCQDARRLVFGVRQTPPAPLSRTGGQSHKRSSIDRSVRCSFSVRSEIKLNGSKNIFASKQNKGDCFACFALKRNSDFTCETKRKWSETKRKKRNKTKTKQANKRHKAK